MMQLRNIVMASFLGLIILHSPCFAAGTDEAAVSDNTQTTEQDFFKAEIQQVTNEGDEQGMGGVKDYLQTISLRGIENSWKGKDIIIEHTGFNTIGPDAYKKGDLMLIGHELDPDGSDRFFIADAVRESWIYLLLALFAGLVILVGRKQGLKALIALVLSFVIILYGILPMIIHGSDPVIVSALGAMAIALFSVYITYGFRHFSHVAAVSLTLSLLITVLLSQLFTALTKLTGNAQEEVMMLSQLLGTAVNTKGLLLAGFIIGALGVLNDVIVNQVSLVEELHKLDRSLSWVQLFQKGLKVGVDHISAIVNTLFLAYVGASLPLLLLFVADQSTHYTISNVINLEIIATEIVRTLTGSLGLILAVPISTAIAALWLPSGKRAEGPPRHFHALVILLCCLILTACSSSSGTATPKANDPDNQTSTTTSFSGDFTVTGYPNQVTVPELFCEASDCATDQYVYWNITSTENQDLLVFLKQNPGNLGSGEESVGLGCIENGIISYTNDSDEQGLKEFQLTPDLTSNMMAATKESPMTLHLVRLPLSRDESARNCYSQFTTIEAQH